MTFGSYSNRNSQPLNMTQIAQLAPSALATSAHESRSSRYTYIPTTEIIRGMEQAGFLPYGAKQTSPKDDSRAEFTKHLIRFRQADTSAIVKVGDSIPEIVLVNSHDGTSAYKLIMGIYRLICSNGMMVSDSECEAISVHHKGDIVGNVIDGSLRLIGHSAQTLANINQWTRLQLTAGEQSALAEAAHVLRFSDSDGQVSTPIKPDQLLAPRRRDDSGSDLWHTFNRVQENVIRGGLRGTLYEDGRRVRRVTTREVKGIDQDVKLNRALWTLAERMASLKASA